MVTLLGREQVSVATRLPYTRSATLPQSRCSGIATFRIAMFRIAIFGNLVSAGPRRAIPSALDDAPLFCDPLCSKIVILAAR